MIDYLLLKNTILSTPSCQGYIVTNDMPKDPDYYLKDKAIADIFNTPAGVRVVDTYINDITLLSELGSVTGAIIVKKLEGLALTNTVLEVVMRAFKSDRGINVGDAETRQFLDLIAVPDENALPNELTVSENSLIKSLAEKPSSLSYDTVGSSVTPADISIALRNY